MNGPDDTVMPPATGGAAVKTIARWRWWVHLLLIGGYPLIVGLLGAGAESKMPALSGSTGGLLLVSALELVVFGGLFAIAWSASRATRDQLLLRWRGKWGPILFGVGYSIALRLFLLLGVALVVIVLIASKVMTWESLNEFAKANQPDVETIVDIKALSDNPVYFLLTLTLVSFVVAGLREELWRAGFLAGLQALWPGWFSSRIGQIGAVTLGAIVFGLGHWPQGPGGVVLTGVLGLGLGLIMVFHRSIWPAVIAHGMFNATSFALLPLVDQLR